MTVVFKFAEPSEGHADVQPAARSGLYRDHAKRYLDILLILLAAPIVLPLVLVLAVFASLDGGMPFYRQERVGRDGRRYRMLKLRTMVPDAEAALARHLTANPEAKAEWDLMQKLSEDPRITAFGRILRKTSLDELPQLWNVLKGDMSLVGPRPMMPDQCSLYPGRAYYRLRPGITGPWQVTERNLSTFAQRAKFDSSYEETMSLKTDIGLIFATVGVVLAATGR